MTDEQDKDDWGEVEDTLERHTGLGGSDAPAVFDVDRFRTRYDLWSEKTAAPGFQPQTKTERMRIGTLMQPVITQLYEERTGYRVVPVDTIRHPRHRWMLANLDGRIAGEPRIVEVKNTSTRQGWGDEGTDEVPIYVRLQCDHYLVVADADVCDVAVLIAGGDFRIYTLKYDPNRADELIKVERDFWLMVERREPPPPRTLGDVVARWGALNSVGAVAAGATELRAIKLLRDIRRERKNLDTEEVLAKEVVLRALADHGDTLVDGEEVLASWHLDQGRREYTVAARDPVRRLLIK